MGRNDQGIKMGGGWGKQCSNTEGAIEKLRTKVEKLRQRKACLRKKFQKAQGTGKRCR